jgi:hypothetical protein
VAVGLAGRSTEVAGRPSLVLLLLVVLPLVEILRFLEMQQLLVMNLYQHLLQQLQLVLEVPIRQQQHYLIQ